MSLNVKRIFVLIFVPFFISCESFLKFLDIDSDALVISRVLHELADEFLLKEKIEFDILTFESDSRLLLEVSSNFMKKSQGKFSYQVIRHKKFPVNEFSRICTILKISSRFMISNGTKINPLSILHLFQI